MQVEREESKSKYQKTGEGRVGRPNACNTKKKNCNKKDTKKHVLGCVPCAQMVAVTSARPKMVAGNFRREK